jgi:hypothetical protein
LFIDLWWYSSFTESESWALIILRHICRFTISQMDMNEVGTYALWDLCTLGNFMSKLLIAYAIVDSLCRLDELYMRAWHGYHNRRKWTDAWSVLERPLNEENQRV